MKKLKEGHWPIFLLSSISSISNLFLPIILVRILTPEEIGTYKTFFIYLSLLPFIVMSGGPLHSVYYWTGRPEEERKKFFNATWTLCIVLSAFIPLIGLPLDFTLAKHLHVTPIFLFFLLLASFLWTPISHYTEASIALGHRVRGSVFETLFELVKIFGFIALAFTTHNLTHIFEFFTVLCILKMAMVTWLNKRQHGIVWDWDMKYMKEVMTYSFPIALSGFLSIIVDKFDLILLSSQMDSRHFAFYSMGCLVIPPLYLLEMSVQKILIPQLSITYREKRWQNAAGHYRKAVSDIAFLIIPAVVGLIVYARPIVVLLFTEEYLESTIYLQLFALSYLLLLIPHDSVARATGQTRWILKTYLVVAPLALLATYLVSAHFNPAIVLATTIAVKFVPKVLGLWISVHTMKWSWSELWPKRHLSLFLGLAGLLSIMSWLIQPFFSNELMWFFIGGGAFGVIYLGAAHFILKHKYYEKH